jgi:DNA-binding NarL/FixJ family response regulator
MNRPKIAIVDANTLAAVGLKQILQNVMPIMTVDTYGSFGELEANHPEQYFHYFVAMDIALENKAFFLENRKKTIVLTTLNSTLRSSSAGLQGKNSPLSTLHSLNVNAPEPELVRSILALEQHAHGHGQNLPPMPKALQQKILSDREIEVMSLIVQGYINKEIADKLNISLSTVITHRKNIMDKLGVKSVSALTIYAVMHGYVDINSI